VENLKKVNSAHLYWEVAHREKSFIFLFIIFSLLNGSHFLFLLIWRPFNSTQFYASGKTHKNK